MCGPTPGRSPQIRGRFNRVALLEHPSESMLKLYDTGAARISWQGQDKALLAQDAVGVPVGVCAEAFFSAGSLNRAFGIR